MNESTFTIALLLNEKSSTIQHHTVVVILDALDECGTPAKRQSLLNILSELTKDVPSLRFIITSQPERGISGALDTRPHILACELDTLSLDIARDISTYLAICIQQIKSKSPE